MGFDHRVPAPHSPPPSPLSLLARRSIFPGVKEKGFAYMLWAACFMGVCGLQRLYAGKIGTGLLYLFTFGLAGIGQLVDLFLIPRMVEDANNRLLMQGAVVQGALGAGSAVPVVRRLPRTTEEMQVALVQAAAQHEGRLTIPDGVAATGRGFQEVKRQLDEMAVNGYIELDSDDEGQVFYRFPGLSDD